MAEKRISIQKAGNPASGILGIVAMVTVGAALLGFLYYKSLPAPPPFEISNFVGQPEMYSAEKGGWVPAERGAQLTSRDKIRTDANSEVDMRMGDEVVLRLKGDSQLEGQGPKLFDQETAYRLKLIQGSILGAANKQLKEKGSFELSTPVLVAAVRGTLFNVMVSPKDEKSTVGVLRGQVEVRPNKMFSGEGVMVGNVQKLEMTPNSMTMAPIRITRDDWNRMKEAYELIQRSAAFEAMQIDLSKEAGNLFSNVVFDHGTFYTEKFGFAGREFFKDEDSGEVYLEGDYDVFPRGAVVGLYLKTRDFDLSKYNRLTFEVRTVPEEGVPEVFRMEFKTRGQIQRVASPRHFKREWQPYEVVFQASKPVIVDEITIAFSHEHVGENKKGTLQFRNFNLVPAEAKPSAGTDAAAKSVQTLDTLALEPDTGKQII